jgi:hypothetical protein
LYALRCTVPPLLLLLLLSQQLAVPPTEPVLHPGELLAVAAARH